MSNGHRMRSAVASALAQLVEALPTRSNTMLLLDSYTRVMLVEPAVDPDVLPEAVVEILVQDDYFPRAKRLREVALIVQARRRHAAAVQARTITVDTRTHCPQCGGCYEWYGSPGRLLCPCQQAVADEYAQLQALRRSPQLADGARKSNALERVNVRALLPERAQSLDASHRDDA